MTNTAAHENDPAIQARAIRKAVQDNGLPSRFTSVGMTSIERFLRPVSYQGFPDALLPEALRDSNLLQLPRSVDGALEITVASHHDRV